MRVCVKKLYREYVQFFFLLSGVLCIVLGGGDGGIGKTNFEDGDRNGGMEVNGIVHTRFITRSSLYIYTRENGRKKNIYDYYCSYTLYDTHVVILLFSLLPVEYIYIYIILLFSDDMMYKGCRSGTGSGLEGSDYTRENPFVRLLISLFRFDAARAFSIDLIHASAAAGVTIRRSLMIGFGFFAHR